MKRILPVIIVFACLMSAKAQRITVTSGAEDVGDGYNSAFTLFVPHTTVKSLEHKWIDFLKDNNAKVKTPKDEINGQNAVIKSLNRDTLQIYSKIMENADGISLIAGFKRGETFISPSTAPEEAKVIEKLLHDIALPLAKDGLHDKLRDATKALEAVVRENESLAQKNERLRADNVKMKTQIADNEREVSDNEKKISALNAEVESKRNAQAAIKEKEKDLE